MAIATKQRIKTQKDCRRFNDCEAPLCPLDETSLRAGIWYSNEQICKSHKFASFGWIKRQKKIARLRLAANAGFFTVAMLNSIRAITKNLKGADPANFESEAKWFKQRGRQGSKNQGDCKANQNQKGGVPIAKKKNNLVHAGKNHSAGIVVGKSATQKQRRVNEMSFLW